MGDRTRLGDATGLDPDITVQEIEERFGADGNAVSLLAVAEASLNRMPAAVSVWLSEPDRCQEWLEVLALQESQHQLAWWSKISSVGIEHPDALRLDRRLARIRQRRREAEYIVFRRADPWPGDDPEAIAARQLEIHQSHDAEALLRRWKAGQAAVSPAAKRLLEMDDVQFRELVGHNVQGRVDADVLTHPAVLSRWFGTLVELGTATCEQIGLRTGDNIITGRFAVPDRYLISTRHDERVDAWANKLTFLAHLRVRLLEHALHREAVYQAHPELREQVQHELRSCYPERYARHLRQAQVSASLGAGPPAGALLTPHPAVFADYAARLRQYEWDLRWIYDGHRVWLDGRCGTEWRKHGRIIVTAVRSRRSTGKNAWQWSKPNFVFYNRRSRRYTALTGPDAFGDLAATNPATTPVRHLKAIVPQVREHLEALIPPDGYRWRQPYPPGLLREQAAP